MTYGAPAKIRFCYRNVKRNKIYNAYVEKGEYMLLETIVQYCNEKYLSYGDYCGNMTCTHPSGQCSGSCYNCLYHVHFPDRAPENSKTLYDCPKMLYHYVCQYSYLYATELFCAFQSKLDFLMDYPYFHILSLGCGGCADLMGFEYFAHQNNMSAPVSYIGIDVNENWKDVHTAIKAYANANNIRFNIPFYEDVFSAFRERDIHKTNIIIISYLISYLYNSGQIQQIDELVEMVADRIVSKKGASNKLLFVINDVNSNRRGRDFFTHFESAIRKKGLKISRRGFRFFESDTLNDWQRIGTPYDVRHSVFKIPLEIKNRYHAQSTVQSTIQLLLEVE